MSDKPLPERGMQPASFDEIYAAVEGATYDTERLADSYKDDNRRRRTAVLDRLVLLMGVGPDYFKEALRKSSQRISPQKRRGE